MYNNEIVEDFYKTLTKSFFKSGHICGIDENIIRNAYEQVKSKINEGFSLIDSSCNEFSKKLLASRKEETFNEKIPEGLKLVFSGKNGSKLYVQDNYNLSANFVSAALVTNDQILLERDLHDLKKSFYPEDYLEAKRIHDWILHDGIITLKEYLKQ